MARESKKWWKYLFTIDSNSTSLKEPIIKIVVFFAFGFLVFNRAKFLHITPPLLATIVETVIRILIVFGGIMAYYSTMQLLIVCLNRVKKKKAKKSVISTEDLLEIFSMNRTIEIEVVHGGRNIKIGVETDQDKKNALTILGRNYYIGDMEYDSINTFGDALREKFGETLTVYDSRHELSWKKRF